MSYAVIVPFRPEPDGRGPGSSRADIWAWLSRRWHAFGANVVKADSGDSKMNRSEARNVGAGAAVEMGCETLVFADADVYVPRAQLEAAIALVEEPGDTEWVIAYEHYLQLTAGDTSHFLKCEPTHEYGPIENPRWSTNQGNAGMLVVSKRAFAAVGGYDERFIEWGWEDWAFANALSTLVHPQVRVPGYVLHLCHPRSPNRTKRQGRALFERYDAAMGDREAMVDLVHESLASRERERS